MSSPLPDDVAAARRALGVSLREFGHALAGHHVDTADLIEARKQLDELRARFEEGDGRSRAMERPVGDWGQGPADGAKMLSFDERPISGRAAPYGLDVSVERHGREAVGKVTFGAAHEGAPGRCHGGIVAALIDDVFGFVLTIEQQAAFTGTLTVRYESGVPIGIPLECRVRLAEQDGRKLHLTGEITAFPPDGPPKITTTATAIFISIDPDRFGQGALA